MKIKVDLVQDKGMKERDVRDAIERSAARARAIAASQGKGEISQEQMRRVMEQNAEKDRQKGKI